jgi:anti-sigma regulatory factor (Ser/Thr protein kinase)
VTIERQESSPEVELPSSGVWWIHGAGQRAVTVDSILHSVDASLVLGERDRFAARLCIDEAITNACEHAGVSPERPIEIELHVASPRWALRVRDAGPGHTRDGEAGGALDEGGRGLRFIAGYCERVVVSEGGRTITLWGRAEER